MLCNKLQQGQAQENLTTCVERLGNAICTDCDTSIALKLGTRHLLEVIRCLAFDLCVLLCYIASHT